ncbi:hypothetical protein MRS44_006304 [Fusarium solani]|jgi:hypothetical protein|uniref:Uncharacterized protein n=1 Tax=Fusarium solani TaxID=169388 RepID=A0A9P9RE52_FUSSL|nr:uncharacterized protein B0J15DRAFT_557544 [Fusarium solani]KAH7275484.1 hypothetical protein B0J15DRAFT_557544 [Fusarium solani]KAJ3465646.1 hypothetical protein MRS44_006304 [Fusarium solani]
MAMDNAGIYGGGTFGTFAFGYVFASAIALQIVSQGFPHGEILRSLNWRTWARTTKSKTGGKSPLKIVTRSEVVNIDHDNFLDDEPLERMVQHLFSHSICQPIQKLLVGYLRDQAAIKPIRHCHSLDLLRDFPSMLLSSLPLLVPLWVFTSYYWTSLFGVMIWERFGSDVVHGLLSRSLECFRWGWRFLRDSHRAIFRINGVVAMTKGARRVLPWVGYDDGPLGSVLYDGVSP